MTESTQLALFPLQTVLFPGGLLPLRVFEPRYLDLVSHCLRTDESFGIVLIAEGQEVGQPARPHRTGTRARISSCDAQQSGLLQITVTGERRFRILDTATGPNGLLSARVEWLQQRPALALPAEHAMLVTVLRGIIDDLGSEHFPAPWHFDDADWVGMRLAAVLPIPERARQALLELELPLDRLEIIHRYLSQRGLRPD